MAASPSGLVLGSLPIPRTRLIGREAEIAIARSLLLDEAVPLLTLTGPAGVGKTRLALAVAAQVSPQVRDGVALIPLAPIRDASLVISTIAHALRVPENPGWPATRAIAEALRDRQILLVLDNLEQVATAAPLLNELLEACPRLQLLATSRIRLRISAEYLLPVMPLPLPSPDRRLTPQALAESPAVSLFVERARQGRPDFVLTQDNAASVAAIVESLDGVPLAIELAAARLSALSPEALLARLEHRLRLLSGGSQDLPPRLRTMTDAIAWSHDLLGPAEQALLRRLAIFLGGWTLEAAEAVCPAVGEPPLDVFDGITSLVDKSLIRTMPAPTSAPRYTMLETVREFGLERLADTSELATARDVHAAWCLALAEEAEPHLIGAQQSDWLARLEADHDNMRAALGWWKEQGDADRGLRLATALMRFWDTRDYMSEGRPHLSTFLDLGGDSVSPETRAKALDAASELASFEGEPALAARLAAEALAIRRERNDDPGIARALWLLAMNTLAMGNVDQARTFIDDGLAVARRAGDRAGEGLLLRVSGTMHAYRGEPALAVLSYEAALKTWTALGARDDLCNDLGELALTVGHLGNRARAIDLWEQMLPLAREIGEEWMIALYLEGHAEMALREDRPDLTARLLGAADAWRVRRRAPLLGYVPYVREAFSAAQQRLGGEAFAVALADGQALTLDEAVHEAQAAFAALPSPSPQLPDWAVSLALTAREYEVLQFLTRRLSDREIADALFVSPRTIHGHVASIIAKLGVTNRRDAARVAEAHVLA